MATIKVACPKCGQKVSGDETFYGTIVECPICSADIRFPGQRRGESKAAGGDIRPVPAEGSGGDVGPQRATPESPIREGAAAAESPSPGKDPRRDEDAVEDLPPSPLWGALSIVSAVLSLVLCLLGGVLFAPLAIIFGHTALAKARQSPVQPAPGHTLGAIGLIIGYVSLVLTLLVLLAAVIFDAPLREFLRRS